VAPFGFIITLRFGGTYSLRVLRNVATSQKTAFFIVAAVFWDVAPCRFIIILRFGGTYRLRVLRNVATFQKTAFFIVAAVFWVVEPCGFIIILRFGGTYRLRNVATSQKTAFFIVAAVKTSNPRSQFLQNVSVGFLTTLSVSGLNWEQTFLISWRSHRGICVGGEEKNI
jgi:hypothetical protein